MGNWGTGGVNAVMKRPGHVTISWGTVRYSAPIRLSIPLFITFHCSVRLRHSFAVNHINKSPCKQLFKYLKVTVPLYQSAQTELRLDLFISFTVMSQLLVAVLGNELHFDATFFLTCDILEGSSST